MEMSFMAAVKHRRTNYALGKEKIVGADQIEELVNTAVKHTPSAFNSQSARVIVLFNEQHDRLWDIVKAEFKKIISLERFLVTEEKINQSFQSGFGIILYFEDLNVVKELQQRFPKYKEKFASWSEYSSGMLQFII